MGSPICRRIRLDDSGPGIRVCLLPCFQRVEGAGRRSEVRVCAGGHKAGIHGRPIIGCANRLSLNDLTLWIRRRGGHEPSSLWARNGFLVGFTSTEKEWNDGEVHRWLVDCGNDLGFARRLPLRRRWLFFRRVPGSLPKPVARLRSPRRCTYLCSPVYFTGLHSPDRRWSSHGGVRLALSGLAELLSPLLDLVKWGRS
jgi:hypothetical protein